MIISYIITLILYLWVYFLAKNTYEVDEVWDSEIREYITKTKSIKIPRWWILVCILCFCIPIFNVVTSLTLFIMFLWIALGEQEYKVIISKKHPNWKKITEFFSKSL